MLSVIKRVIKNRIDINSISNSYFNLAINSEGRIANTLQYERFSNEEIFVLEKEILSKISNILDCNWLCSCITNSGMSSILLVVMFTKHYFLRYNDLVLYSSGLYSASRELINQEYNCRVEEFNNNINDSNLINLILIKKPKILFLDFIDTNTLKRRNVYLILKFLYENYFEDIKIVIDFTLEPLIDFEKVFKPNKSIEVYLYASFSKYFQFGIDNTLVGCVVSHKNYYPNFDYYRSLTSTNINQAFTSSIPVIDKTTLKYSLFIIYSNSKMFYDYFYELGLNNFFNLTYDKLFLTGLFFLELIKTKEQDYQNDIIVKNLVNKVNKVLDILIYSSSFGFTRPSVSIVKPNYTEKIRFWVGTLNGEHIINILSELKLEVMVRNNL